MIQIFGDTKWAADISNNLFLMNDPTLHRDAAER
jgi:hypothetical protein